MRSQLKAVNRRLAPGTAARIVLPIVVHLDRFAPEMPVGRRPAVHRVDQVEHLDDAKGTQVEVGLDQFFETRVRNSAGPEGPHRNRRGPRDADRVGHLDFAAACKARRDQVLGDIARGVSRRAVNL